MDRKHPKARPKDEEGFFERVEVVFLFLTAPAMKLQGKWLKRHRGHGKMLRISKI